MTFGTPNKNEQFIRDVRMPQPLSDADDVRVCIRSGVAAGGDR